MEQPELDIRVCFVDSRSPSVSWDGLREAIRAAECIALDLEMSGIGSKESLRTSCVDERYSCLRETAASHSILSLGIACFQSGHVPDYSRSTDKPNTANGDITTTNSPIYRSTHTSNTGHTNATEVNELNSNGHTGSSKHNNTNGSRYSREPTNPNNDSQHANHTNDPSDTDDSSSGHIINHTNEPSCNSSSSRHVLPSNTSGNGYAVKVKTSVFDVLLFSQSSYTIDPVAIHFLLKHGFDFNNLFRYGVHYVPAGNQPIEEDTTDRSVKKLFLEILDSHKPVILHNGLIDLVFLYHHFYAPLPTKQSVFVADLSEMFVGGIYDTKRIPLSDVTQLPTYLEYLLHKSWQVNMFNRSRGLKHISLETPQCGPVNTSTSTTTTSIAAVRVVSLFDKSSGRVPAVCQFYAERGYCLQPLHCDKSHNIAHVIASEDSGATSSEDNKQTLKKSRKRKRRRDRGCGKGEEQEEKSFKGLFSDELMEAKKRLMDQLSIVTDEGGTVIKTTTVPKEMSDDIAGPPENEETSDDRCVIRCSDVSSTVTQLEPSDVPSSANSVNTSSLSCKSGRDAFATGYYFLQSALARASPQEKMLTVEDLVLVHSEHRNKVPINGKPMPLLIVKSQYCNNSVNHKKIQDERKC